MPTFLLRPCGWTFVAVFSSAAALSDPGGTLADWQRHREALLVEPGLIRYYPFERHDQPELLLRNAAGPEGALRFGVIAPPGSPEQVLQVTEGRWPGKPAVRLDTAVLSAPHFEIPDRAFTVEAWIRTHGLGALRGDAVPMGATLLSQGNGYWDGWRLTLHYPERRLGFEIGRPQPSSSVGISGGIAADEIWHHLAATWDGRQMCLYMDGLPVSVGEYSGAYTPGPGFRIGFANAGWGSAVMEVDEVAIFSRALSATEILRHAYFWAPLSDAAAARFAAALEAQARQDIATVISELSALLTQPDLPPVYQAVAHLGLGQALMEQIPGPAAGREIGRVLEMPDIPDGLRAAAFALFLPLLRDGAEVPSSVCQALLQRSEIASAEDIFLLRLGLVRAYRREGNLAAAQRELEALIADPATGSRQRLELLLQWAHSLAQARDFDGARQGYVAVYNAADAPLHFRSYALLCVARSYRHQSNWALARATYEQVLAMPDAPASHLMEAEECCREVDRLAAGLPARDPAWSRVSLPERPTVALELFVSPDGSDDNPGTRDQPFATLERARDVVRQRKAGLRGTIVVSLLPGTYPRSRSLILGPEDSGTAESPVLWRALESGTAILNGGAKLSGFIPVTEPTILARLPEEARGQVVQVNLLALGLPVPASMPTWGFGHEPQPVLELFWEGHPLTMARWPNQGWLQTGAVVDDGSASGKPVFECLEDRVNRWTHARDIMVYGYTRWLWADEALPVQSVDTATHRITLARGTGVGPLTGGPYYFFNLLEEIDQPGEWYLDRETGVLYLWPPSDPVAADAQLSILAEPLVQIRGASWITLEGLVLEMGQDGGVVIADGDHCLVAGCTIRRLGGTAITINGGMAHGIFGCHLHDLGRNGTWVKGGDRRTLTPAGHFVENCHIHHFSRIARTYTPAVFLDGVGNRIAHNRIHDTPCHALRVEGNDHVIEFNDVYRVVLESDDQGAVDMWGNPSYRGNVFRYNYWHDVPPSGHPCGKAGVRLDDAISGTVVYGNVFYRCSQANFGGLQIHGGKENIIENNIFADCRFAISFSPWGQGRWEAFLAGDWMTRLLHQDIDINAPPYTTRYPALARLTENADINMIWRNLAFNCGQFMTRDQGIQDTLDNIVTSTDPGFADATNGNFALPEQSDLFLASGLRRIPFEEIGQYDHPLRARE